MSRAAWLALSLTLASAVTLSPPAKADAPSANATPVYILTLSTDDSDDQADALTQALRAQVRQAHGWSLAETSQSFEILAIALKCPPKPDAGCLQRIADQLHADHYVWGSVSKSRAGEVKVDLHMWGRGKNDVEATDSYSDNLKDASDESLRAIALKLFDKLAGVRPNGGLVVHAGDGGGDVLVDGAARGTLEGGVGHVEVPMGTHTITARVPGFESSSLTTNVAAGAEQDVTLVLKPQAAAAPEAEEPPSSPFPIRKAASYAAIAVGGGFLIASVVEAAQWVGDSDASNSDRQNVPRSVTDVCATQINAAAQDACHRDRDATTVSTLGWVFGGLGAAFVGTGLVLLLTDHPTSDAPATALRPRSKPTFGVVPSLGPRGGSVGLRVTF